MVKKIDVVGIGNAIVDILGHVDDKFLTENNLTKGSMSLIDEQTAINIYDNMPPAIERSGGSAANTIAGLASFGGKGAFIGIVADDSLGKIFQHDLQSIGIYFNTPTAKVNLETARSFVAITPDAERTMATYLGAAGSITPEDIDKELIKSSKIVYLEGYLWDTKNAKDAMNLVIDIAKTSGTKVVFSLSDAFCVERNRSEFLALLNNIDILFANEIEIKSLFETDDLNLAIEKIKGQCEVVAITMGAKGSIIIADKLYNIPAIKTIPVDTTGAGDLYASGFLYGYVNNFDPTKCGQLATIAASEVISHVGARPDVSLQDLILGESKIA